MTPFSDLTGRARLIEVLRWLCILPAAVLANFVVQFFVGAVVQFARSAGWDNLSDSAIAYSTGLLLGYVAPKSAFVVVGSKVAPRRQLGTAIVLTALGILFSLLTHVVGQLLRGSLVGTTNYLHFLAESAGALGGAAYIVLQARRNRHDAERLSV